MTNNKGGWTVKVIITHTAAEEQEAARALAVLLRLLPGARVHKTVSKPPYIRIYLTTRKPGGP